MRAQQRGVAIVLAMSVVALAALTATSMLVSQSSWSRQVELSAGHVQAQLLIRAGLDWSRALLSDDRRTSNVDHLGEPWALQLPPIPVENGSLAGRIEDQQGRFNLNNLVKDGKLQEEQLARFRRLLSILALPAGLADALAERLRTGGGPLTDTADLAQLQGFDAQARARLRPFVAALPRYTAVNVNTATPEVLAALVKGLDLDSARAIAAQRERAYFRNFADFFNLLPPGLALPPEDISVSSDYFIAAMKVRVSGAQAAATALLARGNAGDWPAVVWSRPR